MILIINKSQKDASLISELFYNMGFLSLGITPDKAPQEISNRYRAVLIISPEKLGSLSEYISMLRKYSLSTPIFALSQMTDYAENYPESASLFDKVFYGSEISCTLVSAIIEYQKDAGMRRIGSYKALGIDASVFAKKVTFFDIPTGFTKTETMIVKYLAVMYPATVKASDILRIAFKCAKCPDISNVRTHISSINRKFAKIAGRPLISSEVRVGYTMISPPVFSSSKKDK